MREYILWQDDFSVGVSVIDSQHQKLLQVINAFLYNVEEGAARDAIEESLAEMIRYTEYHFYTEQLLLEPHPDFLAHLNQHWQLIKKTKQIQRDFLSGKVLTNEVFDFLISWLKDHILGTDQVYFTYLRAKDLLPK
jgi:hemerythrin